MTKPWSRTPEQMERLRAHAIKVAKSRIGSKMPEESKRRISEALKGKPSWNFKGNKIDRSKYPNMGTIGKTFKKNTPCKRMKSTEETKLRLRAALSGRNHRCWRGGITSIGKRIRRLPEYLAWRISVYKKHGNTCQQCLGRGRHADHIKPFSIILKEFLFNNGHLDPVKDVDELTRLSIDHKPFWNVANGQVLCKLCNCTKRDVWQKQ